jgi:hypothetical protein
MKTAKVFISKNATLLFARWGTFCHQSIIKTLTEQPDITTIVRAKNALADVQNPNIWLMV